MSALHRITVSLLAIIIGASAVLPAFTKAAIVEPGFEKEVIATGFVLPVAMAFAPDGRIFIAEKGGSVRVIKNGLVLPAPLITLTDINSFGDRGLLSLVLDPNFASNGYVYLAYTFENTPGANVGGAKTGRIVRITVVGDTALESSKVVIMGTHGGTAAAPSCDNVATTVDCIPSDSLSHSVGGLRFGPDGKLYATLGDGAHFDYADPRSLRAQNLDSLAGKVIRINTDGTAPADNPFFTGNPQDNRSKVYAYGLRNSFRLNFRPATGALFSGDVGWSSWEEVNQIKAGANYGWPCWEGAATTTHNCVSSTTAPTYTYAHNQFGAGSVTVGSFAANNAYPDAYDSSLFFGDYAQNWIKRLVVDSNNAFVSVHNFMDDPDGPVDISTGPDGNVYFMSIYTGTLHRITHTTGNRKPVAMVAATPTAGLQPLQVTFSSAGSYDPDAEAITYNWNFGDGATSSAANPVHTYTVNGTRQATLTVTDINGAAVSKSVTITVGNQSPLAQITAPVSGSLYVPGDIIELKGTATDPEDGVLPASAYNWQVVLHHNTHSHTIQQFIGTKNPWFTALDHNSPDVYTEVILTVTDSAGLVSKHSVNLYINNGGGPGNLIQNPSVEIPEDGVSGNPLKWLRGNFGFNNPTFTYPVAGLEGTEALNIAMDFYSDGNAKWYFSPVQVTPGKEYVYSHFYTSTATTTLTMQLGLANGSNQFVNLGTVPPAATSTKIERIILIPANVNTMTMFHEISQVGSLTTDNFSLIQNLAGDTTAPSVFISSPVDASQVTGTQVVSAPAGDTGGIAGVTLVIDGVQVGVQDTVAPYEFPWNSTTVTNGAHTISAVARDISGNTATATPIMVTVSNQAAITNLIQNGNLETENGASPLGWIQGGWGNHTRTYSYPVIGRDGGKAARTTITNYPPLPTGTGDAKWAFNTVAVTPGTVYTYSDYYRSNTISDIIGQYTLQNGSFHYFGLAKEIQPTTTWTYIKGTFTPPADATRVTLFHLISAEGYVEIDDAMLYQAGTSTPSETNVPIVQFTNPLQGQTVSGTVQITASSTDDTAVTYIFYAVDGIPVSGQITTAPYAFAWDTTTVANGPHTIKATTHDPSGNNAAHTIDVTVQNTIAPEPGNLILNPSLETAGAGGDPAQWFRGGWGTNTRTFTYPVVGTSSPKAARVEISAFTNGDAKWYFADVPVTSGVTYAFKHAYKSTVPTEVLARFTLPGGAHQYQYLGAVSPAANWTYSSYSIVPLANATALTVLHVIYSVGSLEVDDFSLISPAAVVDTTAPIVAVTSPANAAVVSQTITIAASSTDAVGVTGVTLLIDGVATGTQDTSAPYDFIWNSASVSNGSHTIAAVARDAVGNIATSTAINVTVSNAVSSTSLITNPSFATAGAGGDPANWFRGRWGNNTTIFTYPVTGPSDTQAARVEVTAHVDGDAKWRHDDVPVTAGGVHTFTHDYRSNVLTNITVQYTLSNGTFQYVSLGNFPAAVTWTSITQTFVAPASSTSMTIFHAMNTVGWLEVDNYKLNSGNANQFASGMISLTFDDGWITHYTTALPILNAANVKGVFHIVSQETLQAVPQEGVANSSLQVLAVSGDPDAWQRGGWGDNVRVHSSPIIGAAGNRVAQVDITAYTSGDAKWYFNEVPVVAGEDYTFANKYSSSIPSEVLVRVTRTGGLVQYMYLATLPSSNGTWQTFSQSVLLPTDAVSVTMFHVINAVGTLSIDDASVKRVQDFVDPAQVLAMQAAGHEISSHTQTHANLTTLTTVQAQTEISGSRTDLLNMGVTTVNTIAYPFGAYNTGIQQITQNSGYIAGRSVERGYNTKATDKYALKIQSMNRTTTLSEMQGWINQAKFDNTWLILMFHQIDNDPAATFGVSSQMLSDTVSTIGTAGIEVVSLVQGVSRMNP